MKLIKRLLAFGLAAMLCLTAAGCQAKDTTWIAKSGEETANTGVYMLYLINAYAQAMTKVQTDAAAEGESGASSMTDAEVLKAAIEGLPAEEWIVNTAKKDIQRYFATNQKFDEMGLALSEDDQASIDYYASQMYAQSEEFLTQNSIGQESVKQYYANNFKTNTIFMSLYDEGGEKEIPADEVAQKFADLYNSTKVILIEKPIEETEEDGDEDESSSAAEPSSDSEAVQSAETSAEESTQAESSSAESSASDVDGDDPEAPETTEPADTRPYEEKLAEARARAQQYYDRALAGEDFDALIAEWEAEDFGEIDLGHDHAEAGSHDLLTAIGGSQIPAKYAEVMDSAPIGVPQMFEDDNFFYVAVRNDVMANPSLIADYRMAVLMELRTDDYKTMVEEWIALVEVEFNEATLKEFTPKKVKLDA